MQETFSKLMLEIPALVLMFYFVKMFLSSMEKRDQMFVASLNQMHVDNMEAREKTRAALKENAHQSAQCTVAMTEMTKSLREFIATVNRKPAPLPE